MNSLTSPATEDLGPLRDTLRLCLIPGVGPRTRRALLERFGTCAAALAASAEQLLQVPGIGPRLCDRIRRAGDMDVDREIDLCRKHDIDIIPDTDPRYPNLLHEIPDPPGLLFRRGDCKPQDRLALAIVGTRHATRYGLRQAERLAAGLSRAGLTIVSGLARGIDAAAHRGACRPSAHTRRPQ